MLRLSLNRLINGGTHTKTSQVPEQSIQIVSSLLSIFLSTAVLILVLTCFLACKSISEPVIVTSQILVKIPLAAYVPFVTFQSRFNA
ncbi:hypothetical protein BDV06DRAFT_179199 [Aspergillus oleicola]